MLIVGEIPNLLEFGRFESAKVKQTPREKPAMLSSHSMAIQQFLRKLGLKHRQVQKRTICIEGCSLQEPVGCGLK